MDNLVKLKIEALDNFGNGVARVNNKTYFVENALTDEEVLAKITGEAKNVVFASAIKLLSINKDLREENISGSIKQLVLLITLWLLEA